MADTERPLGWCTLEECKALMEAGLDPKTHDMYYESCGYENDFHPELGVSTAIMNDIWSFQKGYIVPCWSLGKLIHLLPERFKGMNFLESFSHTRNRAEKDYCIFTITAVLAEESTAIESAVHAVLWALGMGYIKKV